MDISKLLDKAREATERRNYDYAVELYLQACSLSPDDPIPRKELRAVENRLAKERGVSFFGKIGVSWNLFKAGLWKSFKKHEYVMQAAEEALRRDPSNIGAMMMLGRAAVAGGFWNAAICTFESIRDAKANGNKKMLIAATRELALAHEALSQFEEACEMWSYIRREEPGNREADEKVRGLSAEIMTTSIKKRQEGAKGEGSIARSIAREGAKTAKAVDVNEIRTTEELAEAIKATQSEIAERPDDPRLLIKLGDLYKRGGEYAKARDAYNNAVNKDSTNATFKFKLDDLEILRLENEHRELANRFKAGDPGARELAAQKQLELLEYKRQSFIGREKMYTTDLPIRFSLGEVLFQIARRKRDMSLYDEAIQRFQFTARDPRYRNASGLYMGQAFVEKGQFDLAMKRFNETLNQIEIKNDDWKGLMYEKADTQEKMKNFHDALHTFQEIYEVDVAFRDVGKRMEVIQKKLG